MEGEKRRAEMLRYIRKSRTPVSGGKLAEIFGVSRQVVVQDIALLRAAKHEIIATNRGYLCGETRGVSRIFCVCHQDGQIEEELNAAVDLGGTVEDVFVKHEVYGELRAELGIRSRRDVKDFLAELKNGTSRPLNNITSGYHFHTISADSEETLSLIEEEFRRLGFLVEQ